jgi:hypothetical protein
MYSRLHQGILLTEFVTRIQRYIITATICREMSIESHASSISKCALSQSWQGVIN